MYASDYRLIEDCWNEKPAKRPTFKQIITRLESIHNSFSHKKRWKVSFLFLPSPFLPFSRTHCHQRLILEAYYQEKGKYL